MTTIAELSPGFANKVLSAQSTFRSVMDAMARPGTIHRIDPLADVPAPLMSGAAAIALTLFDHDTAIWLDSQLAESRAVSKWIKFHTSAPIVTDSAISSFALVSEPLALPALDCFAIGSNDYPDRSTTVIMQVRSLTDGPALTLSGPGINGEATVRATLQTLDLPDLLSINASLFPRGIDLVLVAGDNIVAIPRTTRLIGKQG
jgi:alpha-D-ribose 1-methylphosphonate 5-triphosphate synthase subunit PhnH